MARSLNGSILQKTNKRIGLDQQVGFKKNFIWLVVEPYTSENDGVSWDYDIPNWMEKCSIHVTKHQPEWFNTSNEPLSHVHMSNKFSVPTKTWNVMLGHDQDKMKW